MKMKEAFAKLEAYNELAGLMVGETAALWFADITNGFVMLGGRFTNYNDFRKYVRREYFKEVADKVLNGDGWEINGELDIEGCGQKLRFELTIEH